MYNALFSNSLKFGQARLLLMKCKLDLGIDNRNCNLQGLSLLDLNLLDFNRLKGLNSSNIPCKALVAHLLS